MENVRGGGGDGKRTEIHGKARMGESKGGEAYCRWESERKCREEGERKTEKTTEIRKERRDE